MKKKGDDFNECLQAKTDLNENHQDLRHAAYTATLTTTGHGWTNSTMTETGLSQLYNECQKLDGRLAVVDTAVVKCDNAYAALSAYTNMGECFPDIPACEPYTVASFLTNMSTSSSLGSILGSCQVISDVPRTTYIPEVVAAPPTTTTSSLFGPAVPTTSPHSDVPRGDCMESQQTYFTGSHKLDDNVISAYGNNVDLTIGKGVSIQSYGIDEQTAYRRECEAKGGRFVSFTGTLDCVGFGEFTFATKTDSYQNYGDCFPPLASSSGDGACDHYRSAKPWLIDFAYVWGYACTGREEEAGVSAAAVVGGGSTVAVPPPPPTSVYSSTSSSSSSVPGPSSSSSSSNRTGKGPPPPPSLDTTTATNGGGGFAVVAVVLLLAVFVGTVIHRRRQHQWTRTLTDDINNDDWSCKTWIFRRHHPLVQPWPCPGYRKMIKHPKRMPTQSSNSSCCRRRCDCPGRRLLSIRTVCTLLSS